MCFSAEASFGLSGVLLSAGVYCIQSAVRKNRALIPLSMIPLVFGIQQFCEGLVWLGVGREDSELVRRASLVYLFFALFFWPVWVPGSVVISEPSWAKKKTLAFITLLGLAYGLTLYLPVFLDPELLTIRHSSHHSHSLSYDISRTPLFEVVPMLLCQIVYVALVASPMIITLNRGVFFVCLALVLSASMIHVFYNEAFVSLWCFFAAILSLYLCYFFRTELWRVETS